MRAKLIIRIRFCLIAVITLLTMVIASSCGETYDYTKAHENYDGKQEDFIKAFTETFGAVNDKHDWTNLSDGSISFPDEQGGSKTVRIYTSDPRFTTTPTYLLAEYNIEVGQSCSYQYPTGLKYLYATVESVNEATLYRLPSGLNETPDNEYPLDTNETLPEHPVMRYLLAFESGMAGDEKTNYDFDYNDCVLAVDYVQGQPTATIQLLCAGIDEGIKVTYMRGENLSNPKDETIIEEIHTALGLSGYFDSWDKVYRYDIIGTTNGPDALQPTVQPSYTIELNPGDKNLRMILGRLCCLVGPEDAKDKNRRRLILQLGEGFRLGQVLVIPDRNWSWPTEGTTFAFNYEDFCHWIADDTNHSFWYSSLWKNTNHAEDSAQDDGDIAYGCRLEIDPQHSFISADQLEYYTGYPTTLTLIVSEMLYGAKITLCKYPQQTAYYNHTIKVTNAGYYTVQLSAIDLRNLCGATISGDEETGIEIQCSKCKVTAAYIR